MCEKTWKTPSLTTVFVHLLLCLLSLLCSTILNVWSVISVPFANTLGASRTFSLEKKTTARVPRSRTVISDANLLVQLGRICRQTSFRCRKKVVQEILSLYKKAPCNHKIKVHVCYSTDHFHNIVCNCWKSNLFLFKSFRQSICEPNFDTVFLSWHASSIKCTVARFEYCRVPIEILKFDFSRVEKYRLVMMQPSNDWRRRSRVASMSTCHSRKWLLCSTARENDDFRGVYAVLAGSARAFFCVVPLQNFRFSNLCSTTNWSRTVESANLGWALGLPVGVLWDIKTMQMYGNSFAKRNL